MPNKGTDMIKTFETHYVEFFSPGTFMSESTRKKIDAWSPTLACSLAKKIKERHGATPYGFRFVTMLEAKPVEVEGGEKMDVLPKQVKNSGIYFITGTIRTAEEVLAGTDPEENILRSNVRCNNIPAVIENCNSYKSTMPFEKQDLLVDWDGNILRQGV